MGWSTSFSAPLRDQHIHIWKLSLESALQENVNHDDDDDDDNVILAPVGHVTLLHQCKGHTKSVEAIDVSLDGSKVIWMILSPFVFTLPLCAADDHTVLLVFINRTLYTLPKLYVP